MANLVSKTLGKYEIIELLGKGGMAEVYKAYHPKLERYVTIKVLHSFLAEGRIFWHALSAKPGRWLHCATRTSSRSMTSISKMTNITWSWSLLMGERCKNLCWSWPNLAHICRSGRCCPSCGRLPRRWIMPISRGSSTAISNHPTSSWI